MIKIFYKTLKETHLAMLEEFKPGAWVYVENPIHKELVRLSDEFSIDLGLLQDAVDFYEVPRIEIDGRVIFIYTQFPSRVGDDIQTIPVLFVVGPDFFITVAEQEFPFIKQFINEQVEFYTTQKTKLFLQLFSRISVSYNMFMHDIIRQVKSSRIKLEKISNRDVVQLVFYEEVLNNFASVLVPTKTVLNSILSGRFLKLFEEDKEMVEDLFLESGQLIELSTSNLRNIANIREAYSTIMTNNLNSVIKLLTSLTVILVVPNIISGLYGMNVKLPLAGSPYAFYVITVFVLAVSLGLAAFFAAKRFL